MRSGLYLLKANGWLWRGVVGSGASFAGRSGDGFWTLLQTDALKLDLNHIVMTVIARSPLSLVLVLIGTASAAGGEGSRRRRRLRPSYHSSTVLLNLSWGRMTLGRSFAWYLMVRFHSIRKENGTRQCKERKCQCVLVNEREREY